MTPRKPFPKLCYHKGTRRFFIDYQGSWRYWPTGTSKAIAQADYDSMRESYEASGTFAMPQKDRRAGRTIDTLIDACLKHCDVYYANSKATVGNIERALTPLHVRFGRRPIEAFGPRLLRDVRDVRDDMVNVGSAEVLDELTDLGLYQQGLPGLATAANSPMGPGLGTCLYLPQLLSCPRRGIVVDQSRAGLAEPDAVRDAAPLLGRHVGVEPARAVTGTRDMRSHANAADGVSGIEARSGRRRPTARALVHDASRKCSLRGRLEVVRIAWSQGLGELGAGKASTKCPRLICPRNHFNPVAPASTFSNS